MDQTYEGQPYRAEGGRERAKNYNLRQWWEALKKTRVEVGNDNLGIVSAGVAFYIFLGIFPLLAVFLSLYGMFSSPQDVMETMEVFSGMVPEDIVSIVEEQLTRLAGSAGVASRAALISLLVALWTGSKAIKGMMNALSIVNGKKDARNIFQRTFVALCLTLGGVFLSIVAVFLLAGIPAITAFFNLGPILSALMEVARWALLGLAVATGLGILYRFGADRRGEKIKMFTPGAAVATVVWLAASGLFSWFVANFGNYNKTYGSLGAIVILLLWLSLSSFVFIIGAELDVELDRQAGKTR